MTDVANRAQSGAADLRRKVAPVGLVGMGLLYGSLGLLIINVAQGQTSAGQASKTGAIERVATAPFGRFLLIVLTVGLVALVVWKATQAIAGDPIDGDDASDRAKNGVKAVLYAGTAITSISILIANWSGGSSGSGSGSGSGGSGGGQQEAAAVVMGWPGGRWIVMIAGLAAIGYGCHQLWEHTIRTEFMERIGDVGAKERTAIETAGRIGFAGRAALVIGFGVFAVVAGVQYDPNDVKGLSGLLADLSGNPLGRVVLWVIAIGTLAYGVFTLAEAKYRRSY